MKRIVLLACCILCLCGCTGAKELEELQIVAGLYLDTTDSGSLRLTAETVDFSDGTEKPAVYSAEGMGIGECMTRMMDLCGRKLYLSHAEVIVVSKQYADTRFRELTEYILHDNDLRFTTAVAVSLEDTANALVAAESGMIRSYEIARLLQNNHNTGRTVNKESYVAIRELYDIGETTVLPAIAIKENAVCARGSVVIGKTGMITLDDTDTMLLNLLCGDLQHGSLGFEMDGQDVSVDITDCRTRFDCNAFDGVVKYHADVNLSVEAQAIFDAKELEYALRDYLRDAVQELYRRLRDAEADVAGVGRMLRAYHPEQYRIMEEEPIFPGSVLEFRVRIETGEVVY